MNNGLNLKEISKQIKASGKSGSLIWSREEKQHFITNRHFLLRVEEVPSEVLIALFSIFLKVPEKGETLTCYAGKIQDTEKQKPISFEKIYIPEKQNEQGEFAPFIKDLGNKLQARVIQFPGHFAYVNEQYMKMTNDTEPVSTNGPMTPIYFADRNLILLPYRVHETKDDATLSVLIGDKHV